MDDGRHVLSNADLPGMFHGGRGRLICRAPLSRAAVMLRPAAKCPGANKPRRFIFPKGKEDSRVNWSYIQEVLPLFGKAALLTVRIGLIGILFAILVGLLCSLIRQLKIPVLRTVVSVYIELSRNTPLLIQLFFIYYGLPKIGIRTSAEACGVAGLAFLGGSYMAEAFRSGMEAVGKIQHESALSLGLTGVQTFRYVILPQAFAISVPALVANVIFLLKETSVFSAISLMDLMFTAKDQIGLYYNTTECLFLLVAFYLVILLPVSLLGSLLERRVRHAEFGT